MRQPRFFIQEKELVYHLVSKTSLDGFVLNEDEKNTFLHLLYQLSNFYFIDVLAFCIMGNHFHIIVRNKLEHQFDDEEILSRLYNYYPKFRKKPQFWRGVFQTQLPFWRKKLASISEFCKDLKQRFSRIYNKENGRQGYFWGERFKSVLLADDKAIRSCIAYIDLNPIRANIINKPEDYPWSSIYYRTKKHFYSKWLSDEFYFYFNELAEHNGIKKSNHWTKKDSLQFYLKYLYNKGIKPSSKGKIIDPRIAKSILSPEESLFQKNKCFSNGVVLGNKTSLKEKIKAYKLENTQFTPPKRFLEIGKGSSFFCLKHFLKN